MLRPGCNAWKHVQSLALTGTALFYKGSQATHYDHYRMHRVFAKTKQNANTADGRVRLEGKIKNKTIFFLAFDGKHTYNLKGKLTDQSANEKWASNFGFGAIRHALDPLWQQKRLPDDLIDNRVAHLIELTAPNGGTTRFGIAAENYEILSVGFNTPRGWHERRYSHYFSKKKHTLEASRTGTALLRWRQTE